MTERVTPDGKTAYLESGSGRPLVLLHGFPLSREMWRPQVDALAHAVRVLTPDLPGFGSSKGFEGTPAVDAMADRVAEFLDALAIKEPAVVGGLSMGGYVALAFARRHARRLCGLILADTKADPDDATGKANRDKAIALAQSSGSRAIIDQMMPNLVGRDTAANRPEVAVELRTIGSAQTPAAVMDALKAMRDRPDARPGLRSIAVPTLVIVGDQDVLTPPAKSEEIAGGVPGAKLVIIPGAGHVANMEAADKFNSTVLEFLKQVA